jgi:hypothetical protein
MTGPPTEYHPYAACLMFKQCHDSYTVRANLRAVLHHGAEIERYARLVVALNGDMPTEKTPSTVGEKS